MRFFARNMINERFLREKVVKKKATNELQNSSVFQCTCTTCAHVHISALVLLNVLTNDHGIPLQSPNIFWHSFDFVGAQIQIPESSQFQYVLGKLCQHVATKVQLFEGARFRFEAFGQCVVGEKIIFENQTCQRAMLNQFLWQPCQPVRAQIEHMQIGEFTEQLRRQNGQQIVIEEDRLDFIQFVDFVQVR